MMRNIRFIQTGCLVICWLFFHQQAAPAQGTATFESEGPAKEVPEGSRFEVSFSLKNTFAKRFIPPDFNGFRVTSGPSEMRGSGFVNGKSYSHQTWTYELEAGAPGTYTIGTATVQTDNRTLRTQPLVVRVGKARKGSTTPPPGADTRVFIRAELDRETAWVGQQVVYQIVLYTQVGISDYDILDLPAFDGFFTQERRRFDTRTRQQKIKGNRYVTRILHEMALFPQQAGDFRIGPARVRLGIEQAGSLSALFGSRPEMVQTQALKLKVKPLPEPAPANFSGVAGQYDWQVAVDKDSLTTDDALTLTVTIEGNGDARRFANPVFDLPDGLEGFEPKVPQQEEYETGEQFVHARTLEYVILPRQPGDYSFMPELVVFDPDSNNYRRLPADAPVQLHVTAGQFYGQQSTPIDSIAGIPPPPPSTLDKLWQTTSVLLRDPVAWSALAGLVLLLFWIYFWRRRPRKARPNIPETPVKPSLKSVRGKMKALAQHIQDPDPKLFYHELLKIVQEHVAMHLDIEPVLLTKERMREKLAERLVPGSTVDTLTRIWQTCEQVVFAGQEPAVHMNTTWQLADNVLRELDTALK